MLQTLILFYLKGLLLSLLFVFILGTAMMIRRVLKKMDRTVRERQTALYHYLIIAILTIPIFSFAFMAILLVLKSR